MGMMDQDILKVLYTEKNRWNGEWEGKRFYHISTDEVYGAPQMNRPEILQKNSAGSHAYEGG